MADFYVKNPLNPYKAARFGLTYQQLVDKNSKDGEHIWVIEVATTELDVGGKKIAPVYINDLNSKELNTLIEEAVSTISTKIDWGILLPDDRPPRVDSVLPASYIVPITTRVAITLEDFQPSYGIDFSSIKLFINNIDVSDEIDLRGDVYKCLVDWYPQMVVYEQEQVEL